MDKNPLLLVFYREMETKVRIDSEGRKMALWASDLKPCNNPEVFTGEAQWVIFCSGISAIAARTMHVCYLRTGDCNHPHKEKAVRAWEANGEDWWFEYQKRETDTERLDYLRTLPYMGGKALVYQLAKNLGITDYCKPDVHLLRMAERFDYDHPQIMCEYIAEYTGKSVAYIDTVLWFAAMKRWAYE